MRKELFIHFAFVISFSIFVFVFKQWFSLYYLPFFIGAIVGTLLPDLDHFLYVYLLGTNDLTSQRANYLMGKREVVRTLDLLAETRYERTRLIFHTALFQLIFLVLTFLLVTSSGSPFGKGLVLAFSLHLLVDQLVDFMALGNLSTWFRNFPLQVYLDKSRETLYWTAILLLVLVFGFIF